VQRTGDARTGPLHIPGGPIFRRHRISIRMSLVYAAAKKTTGRMVSAATFDRSGRVHPQKIAPGEP
jgi:hypothetical protein